MVKRSVFIPIPKKGNAKECSNYRTIALISHSSKEWIITIIKIHLGLFSQTTFWDVEYEKFHYLTNGEKAFKENLKILHFCYIVWYSISLILASVDCYGILFFSCFKLYSYEKQTNVKFYIFLVSDNYFCGLCFKNFLCYYLRSKNSINTYRKVAKMAK